MASSFHEQISQVHVDGPPLPRKLLRVKQSFDDARIDSIAASVRHALVNDLNICTIVNQGDTVALGVGSRGIANLMEIVKETVYVLKQECEANVIIVPAMGSHGGATAKGQEQMLTNLGITKESTGAKVESSMNVNEIGQIEGTNLYQDEISSRANHTLLINRIKAHTSFSSTTVESGLAKMAVVGLGKQKGAAAIHAKGVHGLKHYLAPAARIYESNTNLRGGLAILENAHDHTADIVGLTSHDIGNNKEIQLLKRAKALMARLPFEDIDTLVVRELGKNISGTGMDTNVIQRFKIPRQPEPKDGPDIGTVCVLNLTKETNGNANGMGLANIVTERLVNKINWKATYTNALTSGVLGMWKASMPITMPSDKKAIEMAVLGCGSQEEVPKIVFAVNTLHLNEIWTSANMRSIIERHPRLSIVQEEELFFDNEGTMKSPWSMD